MAVLFFTTCKYTDFFPLQISGHLCFPCFFLRHRGPQTFRFAPSLPRLSARAPPVHEATGGHGFAGPLCRRKRACRSIVENRVKKFFTGCVKSLKNRKLTIHFACRKYVKNYLKNISYSRFFCIFAVPKLRRSVPNQLILNDLGKFEFYFKVIQRCYNLREQNLEGNRKAA